MNVLLQESTPVVIAVIYVSMRISNKPKTIRDFMDIIGLILIGIWVWILWPTEAYYGENEDIKRRGY